MRPGGLQVDLEALGKLSAVEQDAAREQLALVEKAYRANPLLGYHPHPRQVEFHAPPFPPLRAFFGGNRCLAEGTLVRMADWSVRPIEAIRAGDMVLGAWENGTCQPARVLEAICNGPRTCRRFRFGKRGTEEELVATADHRVAARHEKGFRVVLPLGLMDGGTRSRWSIQRSTEVMYSGRFVPEATLLGLLLGDGCTVNGRVSFACADAAVRVVMERECERFGAKLRQNPANLIQFNLSTGSAGRPNGVAAMCKEFGTSGYAHEKRLPDVRDWATTSVAELLAGLLVTDGSVWKASEGWRLGYTSVSRGLAEDVKRVLEERFGVYGSTLLEQERTGRRTEYSLTIGNYHSLSRLSFALPAYGKLAKLRNALAGWDGKQSDASRLRFRGSEEVGRVMTFDLHVDHPAHMFVLANGMVVHNSGKTTATMVDTIIQLVDLELVPAHLLPFRRWGLSEVERWFHCRVVTPDLTGTLSGVVHQKFRDWCPASQLKGGSFDRAYNKVDRVLSFKNGNWVQFMSNDQDADKFGGAALHRIVYDEEPREDIRKESLTRLIDYDGEELFGMTPLHGMSWVFDEVYEPWERGELQGGRVVVVDMDDNPHLSESGKARALSAYSGEERQARKSGRFVSFAGLIYSSFSTSVHVCPEFDVLPRGVEIFAGIDPGIRHMCAVVFCFLDLKDELVVFDEIALQGRTIREVCQEIKRKCLQWGTTLDDGRVESLHPNWFVIDPASRNKSGQTGRSDQQEFSDNGVITIPGQNDVIAGINRTRERLDAGRLKIAANCVELRGEFKRYRWSKDSARSEDGAREKPVKKDDHLLDALRYVVMQRPLKPSELVLPASATMKDRLMRHRLRKLSARKPVEHPSGAGMFQ